MPSSNANHDPVIKANKSSSFCTPYKDIYSLQETNKS